MGARASTAAVQPRALAFAMNISFHQHDDKSSEAWHNDHPIAEQPRNGGGGEKILTISIVSPLERPQWSSAPSLLLFRTAVVKELLRDGGEGDVGDVLLVLCGSPSFRRSFKGVSGQRIGVAAPDGLLIAEYLCANLGSDGEPECGVPPRQYAFISRADVLSACPRTFCTACADELASSG